MRPHRMRVRPEANQEERTIHVTDDDIAHLLAGPPVQATVTDKLNDGNEEEMLKDAEG